MRMIRSFLALGLLIFLPAVVFAGGGRQIITETADGIDIWQKEFDVSGLRPGTYNVIVNAKDAAGNVGVSGPFNIRVNPLAGLPEVRVVYPDQGQIMRGDVNIVGTAMARYGLRQIFIKIDDGEYQMLEGREYWNFNVPAEDLAEGKHTIYVKAIDQNELEGPEFKTDFILDVNAPAFELISHQIGDLISGTVKIKGMVTDMNGIQSLEMSTDGGNNYAKLRTTGGGRNDPARYFQFSIPTKKYEDGPLVYFLRAVNKTGYTETKPFLFFVNNYPPEIEVLSPESTEHSFGRTQVTGRVWSGVGLTEFYYEWAGERHDIPLRPGDPFWAVNVHFSLANNRPVPLRVTAVDKSGNTTVVTHRLQDTRRNRTPTLVIDYPKPAGGLGRMQLAHDQSIYGHILEGFFAYAIIIEDVIEYVMAQPSFCITPDVLNTLPNGGVGNITLRMWAMDEEDTLGQVVSLRINRAAPPDGNPAVESPVVIDSPQYWDDNGDYHTPYLSNSVNYVGYVENYTPGQTLEYRLHWDDSWQTVRVAGNGNFTHTVDLSAYNEGPVHVEFRTRRGDRADAPVYMPVNKFSTLPVISFLTPAQRFGPVQRSTTASGMVDYFVPLQEVSYTLDGRSYTPIDFTAKYGRAWFNNYFDFTSIHNERQKLTIRARDRAGNIVEASPDFVFDNTDAFPRIIHNAPNDKDLVTGDFELSGLAYVDVGITAVYYRILTPFNPWDAAQVTVENRRRDVEFEKIETEQNYAIALSLLDVRDGENVLEIFAEDIYGVQGPVETRVFYVSTAAPDAVVIDPPMEQWNRRNLPVRGTAFDLNGISQMLFSMDNGVSYQRADFVSNPEGDTQWKINLNTEVYADGIHSMLIRSVDKYGVSAFASGIINIDNTPPTIDLGSPRNGDKVGLMLPVTGQVHDAVALALINIQLVNINNPAIQIDYDLDNQFVIMESMDISGFPDGDYTVKVSATDQSGNETSVIRNITIIKARAASEVAIVNPMPGIAHSGPVVVSGRITGAVIPDKVTLYMNKRAFTNIDVNRYGVFCYEMPDNYVWTGEPVVFSAAFDTPDGENIVSYDNLVRVNNHGPVLVVDSHRDGDVITKRPYISGRAFMVSTETSDGLSKKEMKEMFGVRKVELSFDNGRSFVNAKGTGNWRYRLETSELDTGSLPIVIRAIFEDGSVAVRRILLTVDTRSPQVNTIGPLENDTFRDAVLVYGSSGDDFDMDTVEVSLRPGDKLGYAVPGFIQGLYLDASVLGGLNWAVGLGLTFFDDNVKVQFNVSQAAPGRYEGWAFGGKVLANIYNANLSQWFGPDFEFWKTSLVLGAHFSYFMMDPDDELTNPLWMGQFLGQWEIIKADMSYFFPKWKYFKSLSLYVEPGIWFAPSDVSGDSNAWRTKFTIGFGGRVSLF